MKRKNPEVSIIIVNYKVKEELFTLLSSIFKTKTKVLYEVIVVDNDEKPVIHSDLKEKFLDVLYVSGHGNKGYGGGNNIGARKASGQYLFFLNPDTKFLNDALTPLFDFLKTNQRFGIVAPLLFHKNNTPFQQGTELLTPIYGIFSLSFINKLFPSNPISKKYWLGDWDKTQTREVGVIPGTAFMISKKLFEKVGMFDENFFLYFEESDLCKRVRDEGYSVAITKDAKLYHAWESSTKQLPNQKRSQLFSQSKLYYFKKHSGLLSAIFVQAITEFNKYHLLLLFSLIFGTILRFYKIEQLMIFFGDQGWFYLSARDLILKGDIPLVGITSSHTWLHQGPLWTYMLAFMLWIFRFNPLSGAYLAIVLGIISIWLIYLVGKEIFSQLVGILAAILFAISPLIIIHSRMAYHTSPIPFFTILFFYSAYKWVSGDVRFFPALILLLAILYNFELATVMLGFSFLFIFLFGLLRRKAWVLSLKNKNILLFSFLGFIIPMLPILIYDIKNDFIQTIVFAGWIIYKVIASIGVFPLSHAISTTGFSSLLSFLFFMNQKLLFAGNGIVALLLLFISFTFGMYKMFTHYVQKKYSAGLILLLFFFLMLLSGFLAAKTVSEAYLPMFSPFTIFLVALFFEKLIEKKRTMLFGICLLLIIVVVNAYSLIKNNYYMREGGYGFTFLERVAVAKGIINRANGDEYSLIGKGSGSEFQSFTMNYSYLTWWLGHSPSDTRKPLQFVIQETPHGILVYKGE